MNVESANETHTNESPLTCDECSYRVNTEGDLLAHMNLHTPELKCHICSYTVNSGQLLSIHLETDHVANVEVRSQGIQTDLDYTCDSCDLDFERLYDLVIHIKENHNPDNTIVYKFCQLTCKNMKILQNHIPERIFKFPQF